MSKTDKLKNFNAQEVDVNPRELVIITDSNHPLFQDRALWPVNPELVKSIEQYGFKSSIIIGEDQGNLVVVAGRGRTKAAIEADVTTIPAFHIGDINAYHSSEIQALMLSENEKRTNSSTLERAREAMRLYNAKLEDIKGKDWPEEVAWKPSAEEKKRAVEFTAGVFGLTPARLKDMFLLLDEEKIAPELTQAIESEAISFKAALIFVKLSPEEQVAKLEALKPIMAKKAREYEESEGKASKSVSAAEADAVVNRNETIKLKRSEIEKIKARRGTPADVKDFCKWILNPDAVELPYLPGRLEPVKAD